MLIAVYTSITTLTSIDLSLKATVIFALPSPTGTKEPFSTIATLALLVAYVTLSRHATPSLVATTPRFCAKSCIAISSPFLFKTLSPSTTHSKLYEVFSTDSSNTYAISSVASPQAHSVQW